MLSAITPVQVKEYPFGRTMVGRKEGKGRRKPKQSPDEIATIRNVKTD
jgi:hypothetical protein